MAALALALWASSAPIAWGQAAVRALSAADDTTQSTVVQSGDSTVVVVRGEGDSATGTQCVPLPPPVADVVPPVPSVEPAPAAQEGTFHICQPDPAIASDIEHLIAGRGFSATLKSSGDGCADLTIRANSSASNGTASSTLSVGNLTIKIVSEQGATHVTMSGQ
jgi:hypothetical protein